MTSEQEVGSDGMPIAGNRQHHAGPGVWTFWSLRELLRFQALCLLCRLCEASPTSKSAGRAVKSGAMAPPSVLPLHPCRRMFSWSFAG